MHSGTNTEAMIFLSGRCSLKSPPIDEESQDEEEIWKRAIQQIMINPNWTKVNVTGNGNTSDSSIDLLRLLEKDDVMYQVIMSVALSNISV